MPLETFMVTVYCLVCEALNIVVPGGNPRKRGFPPKLSDAEALTMAFVGTVLGYCSDKAVVSVRRPVETVIGQLAERFSAERIGVRKLWQVTVHAPQQMGGQPPRRCLRTHEAALELFVPERSPSRSE